MTVVTVVLGGSTEVLIETACGPTLSVLSCVNYTEQALTIDVDVDVAVDTKYVLLSSPTFRFCCAGMGCMVYQVAGQQL